MENYYFTFGQDHYNTQGQPMKGVWVRVIASNYGIARELFVQQFSSIYMDRPERWAFQYKEKDFDPAYFPGGEYFLISE